jgi:hypothetical protein
MINQAESLDILALSLDIPHSLAEWEGIYDALIRCLGDPDARIWNAAISKLTVAFENERAQHPGNPDQRLKQVLNTATAKIFNNPAIFPELCSRLAFLTWGSPSGQNLLILEWLDQLAAMTHRQTLAQDEILAAQIFYGAYDATWDQVGATLINLLDHPNLNVRACAAHQMGKFYRRATDAKQELWEWEWNNDPQKPYQQVAVRVLPSELTKLIRDRELERPGVAGAFGPVGAILEVDPANAQEWLLDILERSPTPEPYIPYFPCNLAFHAHEQFSRAPDAIRRLIDMGRVDIALAAATDENLRVFGLEPLLIELGNHDVPETIRLASWHLAYHYHILHPQGAERGYVEQLDDLPEIDVFLLFSCTQAVESPYAVVIYAKAPEQTLSLAVAQAWVDQIFPVTVRGNTVADVPVTSKLRCWYDAGYIEYHPLNQNEQLQFHQESVAIDHVIIGYRSQRPWNPRHFLPQKVR